MYARTIRIAQIFVIFCLALYATMIFLGNVMDYDSNYQFVMHVLAMDTTFPDNALMWRAITNDAFVNVAYWGIIATEGAIAVLGWFAVGRLLRNFKKSPERFNRAKTLGFFAFLGAILLWFVGFICFGSEWFAMWQSGTWNGKQTAMDIVTVVGIFLIIYMLPVQLFSQKASEEGKK